MMAVQDKLLTVEEFWAEYAGKPFELVEGRVVEVSPSGFEASEIAWIIGGELRIWLKANPIGHATTADGGYQLGPKTVRAPDIAYISNTKYEMLADKTKYASVVPDLAIEVISPNDNPIEVQEKIALYLKSGVLLVWVFYPKVRQVVVHHPDGTSRTLNIGDILDGEDVLPGFRIAVADLFPPEETDPPA
jgi:Uma2 family endonuclease